MKQPFICRRDHNKRRDETDLRESRQVEPQQSRRLVPTTTTRSGNSIIIIDFIRQQASRNRSLPARFVVYFGSISISLANH